MIPELDATIVRLEDGRELAFSIRGKPDGIPVFGFHGTPGSRRQLEPLAPAAEATGVRLILPDRPGYGASTFQRHRALVDWGRDVGALADYLGLERFGVVGLSGGGPHAAVCAHVLGPRLLGAAIVAGVAPPIGRETLKEVLPLNRLLSAVARRTPWLLRPLARVQVYALKRIPEALIERSLASLPEPDRRALARPELRRAMFEGMRQTPAESALAFAQDFALFEAPWGFRLEEITIPVDVFQGDADRNVPPRHAEIYADHIPDAKLHRYADHGHLSILDEAETILRAASGQSGP